MSEKTLKFGILLFDGAEELDFVGPWEIFTNSAVVRNAGTLPDKEVFMISQSGATVNCAKGMRVEADYSIAEAPDFDVLLIPGGVGTRVEVENQELMRWIAERAPGLTWVTSVCTGSLLLAEAGPAAGKRVTTHWGFIQGLREHGKAGEVLDDVRYIRDGNVVTAAGVSAGIDMALWLIGEIWGPDHARQVQRYAEYDPCPPYQEN
jgi:transcriptional regulator GlxA family with amidase domain